LSDVGFLTAHGTLPRSPAQHIWKQIREKSIQDSVLLTPAVFNFPLETKTRRRDADATEHPNHLQKTLPRTGSLTCTFPALRYS